MRRIATGCGFAGNVGILATVASLGEVATLASSKLKLQQMQANIEFCTNSAQCADGFSVRVFRRCSLGIFFAPKRRGLRRAR